MLFNKKLGPDEYEIVKEGNEEVIRINSINTNYLPSLEDSALCMSRTIEKLIQVPSASRIIFSERRNYEYGFNQVYMLKEIANIYNHLIKQKVVFNFMRDFPSFSSYESGEIEKLQFIILNVLKSDPVGAYVELKRLIRENKIKNEKINDKSVKKEHEIFINLLTDIFNLLDNTKLINSVKNNLEGHSVGSREIYRSVFRASVSPDFMFTRLMAEPPLNGQEIDAYGVDDTEVVIYSVPEDIKYLYHITPIEFKISEDSYELLDLAKNVLSEHQPKAEEFTDPEKMRMNFFNIGRDLISELAEHKGYEINYDEIEKLASILVRYTVGFGLIESLLHDEKIQDITLNGPIGENPIFIVHQDYDECVTNIIPSREDGLSWASKFRILSGRPLDEANPVLDTELIIPGARARVAIISNPLNPVGLAFSFRRHRDKPWTFPLYLENRMMNSLAAGLLDFLIQGSRSMLIAGTRGSGKTSLLQACMLEIKRKYRVITIEDTLELNIDIMRTLGYNIQPMKVRSALLVGGAEIAADEGIRASLRMGDSSLIIGEVRSLEAKSLYEAMRVGALANFVGGTIHGDSPYGVFDRVVNDLEVPRTSFKATDIIVIANPVRSPDGLHKFRRITQITEVRKEWENDPIKEGGFIDLMKYDSQKDELIPTDELINGDSEVIKAIAANVKEWAGNWDAVWDNILLRAKAKATLVDFAKRYNLNDLLESDFVVRSNDQFHKIMDNVKEEKGYLDNKRIFFEWNDWLNKEIRSRLRV